MLLAWGEKQQLVSQVKMTETKLQRPSLRGRPPLWEGDTSGQKMRGNNSLSNKRSEYQNVLWGGEVPGDMTLVPPPWGLPVPSPQNL